MNWELFKPWLAQAARDGLRTVGTALMSYGVIKDGAGLNAFVGAGMTLAGLGWGWWTTGGAQQMAGLLKKLTATATHADAVKVAEVLPPRAAVDTAVKASSAASVVAKVLIAAFVLSAFLAVPSAHAQVRKPALTGNPIADIKTNFEKTTGVKATGDIPFDLLKALDKALLPDLQYAQKLAVATGSKVTAPCYGAWIDMINTQQTAVQTKNADGTATDMPTPDPHLVTDFERMVELRNALQPDSPFMTACSPVANMVKMDVTNFMGIVISGGAGLATLVPGL